MASPLRWPSTSPGAHLRRVHSVPNVPSGTNEVGMPTGRSPVRICLRRALDLGSTTTIEDSSVVRYRRPENQDRLLHTRSLFSQSKAYSNLSAERYPSSTLTIISAKDTTARSLPRGVSHGLTHNVSSHILRLASGSSSHPSDEFAPISLTNPTRIASSCLHSSRIIPDRMPTHALRVRKTARAERPCRIL